MTAASIKPCTVLLVDDDPDVLRAYGRVLERMGARVVVASDGVSALGSLSSQEIDVVITDLNMPVMGGLEFLRAVREINLDVPVVIATGLPELQSAMAAVDYGAFQYLTKPIDPQQLKITVAQATQFHALARLQREAPSSSGIPRDGFRDRAALEVRFARALDKLWIAFQPIVHFRVRDPYAYEALVRSHEASLSTPHALFAAAQELGKMTMLGRKIRQEVATLTRTLAPEVLIFVNLHPADLNDEQLYSKSNPLLQVSSRVVYEITERSELSGVTELAGKLRRLRQMDFRIAIDDLGAGYSSLSSFIHLDPDYVKLDMALIRDVHLSANKLSLVRGITRICHNDMGIRVICEGVESLEEVQVLANEGLSLFQGYYFARPEQGFPLPRFLAE